MLYFETGHLYIKDWTDESSDLLLEFPAFPPMLVLKFWPQFLLVIYRTWADRHKYAGFSQNMLRHPFGYPSFSLQSFLGFGAVTWKNVRNGTFRWGPSSAKAKWRWQMLSFSTFQGGANIDSLDKIRSTSFSTPVNASADLCAPMFLLHWSSGKTSTDLLLSLVWKPQWPPTISWKEQTVSLL